MEKNISPAQPTHRYLIALALGLIMIFISDVEPREVTLALINLAFGFILGFIWSTESLRWGLLISAPMIVLVGFSVAFAGNIEIFLQKDLLLMILAFISACLGNLAGARFKRWRMAQAK
jgi:hypothetical protein